MINTNVIFATVINFAILLSIVYVIFKLIKYFKKNK
jgi:F0F1-type ATP synthase membrane subunit b/b'